MTSSRPPVTLVWFRRDMRLADNPAWAAACARGGTVVPVFIWSPEEEQPWAPGAASCWWLHRSLHALDQALRGAGTPLVVRLGPTVPALQQIAQATGATAVFWNRLYEPAILERDKLAKAVLRGQGLDARSFNAALLVEPWMLQTQQGKPYQVFTPFHRACQALGDPSRPTPAPLRTPAHCAPAIESFPIDDLNLTPTIPWDAGLAATWEPGEAGAKKVLTAFSRGPAEGYHTQRDLPAEHGTSRLSPHLHFGEVSPRQIWWALRATGATVEPYLRQLIWREFAHHLLYHFPHTPEQPLRAEFASFPWAKNPAALRRWQRGETGFPIVDAGMRELWHTGWMHNRVRMIAASFLVKDLLIPWQQGAAWFWDTLVDADLANNTLGWQWVAGCGADAAPYFRIFNPALQGAKFDPQGAYVRRWVPELAAHEARSLHDPEPGSTPGYPAPLVDHAFARDRALESYTAMRAGRAPDKV